MSCWRSSVVVTFPLLVLATLGFAAFGADAIKLEVDATEAPRKILHARMRMAARPGQLTLLYPKWIPGEHGPSGPITDLVGLKITADGKRIEWRRDDEDMFAFNVNVPDGASALDVAFDFLLPPDTGEFSSGPSATARLVDLSWNQVLLYPKGPKASEIMYAASLRLPEGWKYGTALPLASKSSDRLEFASVSLETLVDSPVIAGAHFRSLPLSTSGGPEHFLDIVADSDAALEIKAEDKRHFTQLVSEAGSLFGARHYRDYHFLLTLSDHVASFGLEHHESSDNREGERYLIDEDLRKLGAFLLPHEMVHSWNGKYRRPAGLATPDFHQPMKGDLLWVYEGLTDYLGIILAARSGLWTNDTFQEYLASEAAALDRDPGRKWRPLADTAVAAQLLYYARPEGAAQRRSTDFYQEGDLIWLEVDATIRQGTHGERTLDDFCKKFHGGKDSAPAVMPYALDDVISVLNEVYPHDWKGFFHQRVDEPSEHAPLGGVEACGWRMGYTNTVPELLKARESARKSTDVSFSLGFVVKSDGYIADVVPGSPADKAGVAASMKLMAVNGRHWSPEILRAAIKAAASEKSGPTELLVENNEFFRTCKIEYHEGEKYPQLQRDASKPDLLSQILKPHAQAQVSP